jgi:hypothetical protein
MFSLQTQYYVSRKWTFKVYEFSLVANGKRLPILFLLIFYVYYVYVYEKNLRHVWK